MPTMLLTTKETARELRIAERRVFTLIKDGSLPSVKIGKSRRISREAIEEYIRQQTTTASAAPGA